MSTDLDPKMTLEHVSLARIPARALASLAGLRRLASVSVALDGAFAWVSWEAGDEQVLRAVLPVESVGLFERQGESWHRAGSRLPSFAGNPPGEPMALAGVLTPEPFSAEPPDRVPLVPISFRLARSDRPRPTTAALGPLVGLASWVDVAPSAEIEAVRGAIRGDSALLLGPMLFDWPGSSRYWGDQLLVPIGFEVRPALPEATILEALGDPSRELFRVVASDGPGLELEVEAVPLEVFRSLTRAGVRLALVGAGRP